MTPPPALPEPHVAIRGAILGAPIDGVVGALAKGLTGRPHRLNRLRILSRVIKLYSTYR